jgi:hypothetical protein
LLYRRYCSVFNLSLCRMIVLYLHVYSLLSLSFPPSPTATRNCSTLVWFMYFLCRFELRVHERYVIKDNSWFLSHSMCVKHEFWMSCCLPCFFWSGKCYNLKTFRIDREMFRVMLLFPPHSFLMVTPSTRSTLALISHSGGVKNRRGIN